MRLWHYNLIKYLPRQQLLGQWKELNSIYVKQDNHILINFVYEYSVYDLLIYSQMVLKEMQNRGYKFNLKNYNEYFKEVDEDDLKIEPEMWLIGSDGLFGNHMNYTYLKICCWNLYEKYIRGQKDFTDETIRYIQGVCFNPRFC